MKNRSLAAGICTLLLLMGCSGNAISENELVEGAVSEDVVSEDAILESPSVVFISWEDAGMEEHVMDWKDENLQAAMEATLLGNLTNLEYLDLSFNHISDISALSSLINLSFLELTGNEIDDYSPVDFAEGLYY